LRADRITDTLIDAYCKTITAWWSAHGIAYYETNITTYCRIHTLAYF
jgi:hypothetical protein